MAGPVSIESTLDREERRKPRVSPDFTAHLLAAVEDWYERGHAPRHKEPDTERVKFHNGLLLTRGLEKTIKSIRSTGRRPDTSESPPAFQV